MMDCAQYRRSMLADPRSDSAELRAHLASCHDCTHYTERLRRFESRLDLALRVGTGERSPQTQAAVPLRSHAPAGRRALPLPRTWLAAAASVLLAAVVAGSLWLAAPGSSLAADVVDHMAGEPDAWTRTDVPVPQPKLDKVLSEAHVRLKENAGLVSYASSCSFRGHLVPHLVVQSEAGPVTVMVLTHEAARKPMRFDEHGYRGMIVPVPGHGSLAVLEREPGVDAQALDAIAKRVLGAVEWTT
jgi:hypothetical protein